MSSVQVLHEGYVEDGGETVGSTVTLVRSEDINLVADPGMVKDTGLITDPLKKAGLQLEDITHVFITHHHPDNWLNAGIFPNASVVDFWAIYEDDKWIDHEGKDEYVVNEDIKLISTPGHTQEDATLLVNTEDGVYAITHLWWHEDMTPEVDPLAEDQQRLEENRQRILGIADFIIPAHGGVFPNPKR